MYLHNKLENKGNFFQKIKNLDFVLLTCILILGIISLATMYSTDSGEVLFHTKSHFVKFIIFRHLNEDPPEILNMYLEFSINRYCF